MIQAPQPGRRWAGYVAVSPPRRLEDAFRQRGVTLDQALRQATLSEVEDLLPPCLIGEGLAGDFPVARYPLERWERDGAPHVTETVWYAIGARLARLDMSRLAPVLQVAEEALHRLPPPVRAQDTARGADVVMDVPADP